MTTLCTPEDVLARPTLIGITITEDMTEQIPGYIDEASILIEGYLEHVYPPAPLDETLPNPDPVPDAARIVCARVVARALTAAKTDPNYDSYTASRNMGGFGASNTAHVAADVLGGGVWLTRQDKMALDAISGIGQHQATHVPMFDVPKHVTGFVGALFGRRIQ